MRDDFMCTATTFVVAVTAYGMMVGAVVSGEPRGSAAKNVTADWWLAVPGTVDPKIRQWQREFPDRLEIQHATQFTGHRIYALTLTDRNVPDDSKKKLLVTVSHGHEPAGTAAIMNYVNQLLTGRHLDGKDTDLDVNAILRQTLLTFIPIGNPDGRSRAPVDCWDGSIYSTHEFFDYMKGLRADGTRFPWPNPGVWQGNTERVARPGVTYAQIDKDTYAEPFWAPEKTQYWTLMQRLGQERHYDGLLDLHQTYETEEKFDTFVLYAAADWMPKEFQDYADRWGRDAEQAFRKVGAHFSGIHRRGENPAQKRWIINQFTLKFRTPNLLFETQNNHRNTSIEEQLLYAETMIRVSVDRLMKSE